MMFDWEPELVALQAACNAGRGIETVRSILYSLRHNDLESAHHSYVVDGDKLYQYPAVL